MSATRKAKRAGARKPVDLAKSLEALDDFQENPNNHGHHPDTELKGLFLHVGPRSMVWRYRRQRMKNGVRKMVFKTLGAYPEVGAEAARKAATSFAGSVVDGKAAPGKRDAVTLEKAWPGYLEKLLRTARDKGKPARHHANAVKLGDSLILPQWGKWTLHAMAQAPEEVETWHAKVTRVHGPVSANRACELIRATYNHRAARDVTLSLDRIPTSSVQWNKEEPAQVALAPKDFKKWRTAWDDIENPVQRGYFLFCLLTGVRPGEGARIRKQDIDRKARTFTIPNAKAGKDITLPMTRQIEYAIDLAHNAPPQNPTITMKGLRGMKPGEVRVVERKRPHHEIIDPDLVFPGCRQMPSRTGLPMAGNALRHTFKTLHVSLGISETLSHFLMGHALEGVSAKYIAELIVVHGPALRKAQEKISANVFELLGLQAVIMPR
jgi:Phage integrase family/Arm DNA-binding domain